MGSDASVMHTYLVRILISSISHPGVATYLAVCSSAIDATIAVRDAAYKDGLFVKRVDEVIVVPMKPLGMKLGDVRKL